MVNIHEQRFKKTSFTTYKICEVVMEEGFTSDRSWKVANHVTNLQLMIMETCNL